MILPGEIWALVLLRLQAEKCLVILLSPIWCLNSLDRTETQPWEEHICREVGVAFLIDVIKFP